MPDLEEAHARRVAVVTGGTGEIGRTVAAQADVGAGTLEHASEEQERNGEWAA